ncbi:Protein of unknown function [Pyronema omphalodes CBS 100304]|uniref:Uncharacterized protein n=1 Tax=Pyronema omphalodes (strain CBS 100304) TaxID=1076935 RepID=U4LUS0_PYROM|nr:Protein of unknown function [Pyronema omphalodes CBS 100304]
MQRSSIHSEWRQYSAVLFYWQASGNGATPRIAIAGWSIRFITLGTAVLRFFNVQPDDLLLLYACIIDIRIRQCQEER